MTNRPTGRPNGRPLPHYIYVRRRIAAAVIVLVVILLLSIVIGSLRGSSSTENAAETTTATSEQPSITATDITIGEVSTAAPTGTATASSSATSSTTAAAANSTATACSLNDLVITATSDRPNYADGMQPVFYMTVRNPTNYDCTIDLSANVLRFEVYDLATNQRIWSDVDCNTSEDTGSRVFPANSDVYYEARWSRTNSAPGQCTDRQNVPNGSYYLYTLVGSNHSDPYTFNLGVT
ncbi:MAG: hypothetical protein Q3972_07680 [Corynebacterium sp.]|nr:hypothetical protein [Corynebacterium sp.]